MSELFDELSRAEKLPSPPGVALQILQLNRQDNLEIDALADVVARDPAIVAKLLKAANSSSFGRPGQIADLQQAIMTLGLRSVNVLALSFSLAKTVEPTNEGAFDYVRYWTSTAVTTTAAQYLAAEHAPESRDEAFLAGLLCDVARLALAEVAPSRYKLVLKESERCGVPIEEAERRRLGTDHATLGKELLASWELPEVLCKAIGAHHEPERAGAPDSPAGKLARVLNVATTCGELFAGGEVDLETARLGKRAFEYLGLDAEACSALLKVIQERLPEMSEMLDLEQSDPGVLADIRIQASEHLVRESLALSQQMQVVSKDAERLEEEKNELEARATTDPLTGLRNRGFFDEVLAEWLSGSDPVGLLLCDIDHFKSVNDTHGHQVGDDLLRAVANAVQSEVGADDVVARYGGEELAVLCPVAEPTALADRAEAIRKAIADVGVAAEGARVSRTVSIGGYVARGGQGLTPRLVIERADAELYRAKSDGRDRVYISS
ncbi:MAG: HDOD domain-containing protein [Proteobacteria bacterium]|nr:HDOD domain-containing protein [Pseudomonadota bacterium]